MVFFRIYVQLRISGIRLGGPDVNIYGYICQIWRKHQSSAFMIGQFFFKKNYRPQAKSMGESQKSLWVISGSPSYGFNPVSEGVSAVTTRDHHVFFLN